MTDFDLIVRHFPKNDDIRIYPIADVHFGAIECMEGEWQRFCNNLLSDPNAYVVLCGDLINNATRSSVSNVFEDRLRPREQKKLMAELLTPLKDRILCALPGNHERRSGKVMRCFFVHGSFPVPGRIRRSPSYTAMAVELARLRLRLKFPGMGMV